MPRMHPKHTNCTITSANQGIIIYHTNIVGTESHKKNVCPHLQQCGGCLHPGPAVLYQSQNPRAEEHLGVANLELPRLQTELGNQGGAGLAKAETTGEQVAEGEGWRKPQNVRFPVKCSQGLTL